MGSQPSFSGRGWLRAGGWLALGLLPLVLNADQAMPSGGIPSSMAV